ncbi:MAG: DNA-processing protein DprA [Psychrobacillus psychrodurans]
MLNTTHILTLMNLPRVGRSTVSYIINTITFSPSNLNELIEVITDISKHNSKIKVPDLHDLKEAYLKACGEIEKCENLGIRIIGINESDFPRRLILIPNPPVLLYVKGNIEILNSELSVAVIGTREPSEYGKICGKLFGEMFAKRELVVVSGLAKGIDTLGHRGCIDKNGKTVAVLAQGLDTPVYPKENRSFAEEIISTGGCLVSEYGLGVRGRPNYFIERDRIQSGLSAGVTVIETDIKGGTMHTVNFCIEQNKPLGCLNHPEKFLSNNLKARGNQFLIENKKAIPLFSEEDINLFISNMEKLSDISLKTDIISNKKKNEKKDDDDRAQQLSLF